MGSTLDVARLVHRDGERTVDGLYLGLMVNWRGKECHCLMVSGAWRQPALSGLMLPTDNWTLQSVG